MPRCGSGGLFAPSSSRAGRETWSHGAISSTESSSDSSSLLVGSAGASLAVGRGGGASVRGGAGAGNAAPPRKSASELDASRGVYVISGADGLVVDPIIEADETGTDLAWFFVGELGDLDGDGLPEIYAGDFENTALGPSTGRAYVYSGATHEPLFVFTGEQAGDVAALTYACPSVVRTPSAASRSTKGILVERHENHA